MTTTDRLQEPHNETPQLRPQNPLFSAGPCTKYPGWSLDSLANACLGRSHRSAEGKAKLKAAIDKTKEILRLPEDYRVAIVPASDTGAVEMALWSLLGPRGVYVLAWEAFGADWITDIVDQLKLDDVTPRLAPYGELPSLDDIDFTKDVVFTWNGTTSGLRVPNADWIPEDRDGLSICDATSAIFAHEMDWTKLDVVTYSWQKVLGGEAAHGMLILSPRAVERLESYSPPWPVPKIFRMTKKGKLNEGLFKGATLNTPSLLCVEDYLAALQWVENIGGLDEMISRAERNAETIRSWVRRTDWIDMLGGSSETFSNTSLCIKIVDERIASLSDEDQRTFIKKMLTLLEDEGIAYDINGYRDAPPSLRIWCGGTVETSDIDALLPWLDWAFHSSI